MGAILNELNQIISEKDKVIATVALDLYNELVKATPVDTGYLRNAWTIENESDGSVIINNPTIYAEIRLSPLIEENGKVRQGSRQYPAGVEQIVDKYDKILQTKLKAIKWVHLPHLYYLETTF